MNKKRISALLLVFIFVICQSLTAFAADSGDPEAEDIIVDTAGNMFWSGDNLALSMESLYTAFMMGKTVNINGLSTEGSVFSLAKDITISDSDIVESAFLGAEMVSLKDTSVTGNIFAMGRKVDISGKSNAVYAMGETVMIDTTARAVKAMGKSVSIGGNIDGDVTVESGSTVILEPNTVITGTLTVKAPSEAQVPENAKIGAYEFIETVEEDDEETVKQAAAAVIAKAILRTIYLIIAFILLGLLLCKFFDDDLKKAGDSIKNTPAKSILRGLLWFVATPVIAFFMCITIVLAPAGGLLLMAYLLLYFAAVSFTGASLGRMILPKMNPYGSAAIFIAVLELLRHLPFAGPVVGVLTTVYIVSYVSGIIADNLKKRKERIAAEKAVKDQPAGITKANDSQTKDVIVASAVEDSQAKDAIVVTTVDDSKSNDEIETTTVEDSQTNDTIETTAAEDSQTNDAIEATVVEDSQSNDETENKDTE